MSSGSEGLYLSPLSDMSPATSDCLETYFSGGFILFSNYRVCVDFSGSFYFKALHGRLKSQRDGTGGKLTVDPPFSFRRERGTGKI